MWMAFDRGTLKNSYQSIVHNSIDLMHDRSVIIGNMIKADLVEDPNGGPDILRIAGAFNKDSLDAWGINDLMNEKYSMECLFDSGSHCFYVNGTYLQPNEVPTAWNNLDAWRNGTPFFDAQGNRATLMLGGINGHVTFSGAALTYYKNPADVLSENLMMVAHDNTKGDENVNIFTKEQMDAALATAKTEFEASLNEKIQVAVAAAITEKDTEITQLKASLETASASVTSLTERATAAETKLQAQATEKLVNDRKAILATKQYPDALLEKKSEFLATASEDQFTDFVAEYDLILAVTKPATKETATATVNKGKMVGSITMEDPNKSGNPEINPFI